MPFDTVYGLAADPKQEQAVRRLYELKGRAETDPSALVARDFDYLLECVPELQRARGGASTVAAARAGDADPRESRRPLSLVDRDEPGGDRRSGSLVRRAGRRRPRARRRRRRDQREPPGGRDPKRLDEVPRGDRDGAGALVDGGELPGSPSTVIDLTGAEPRILREGALPGRGSSASTGRGSTIRLTPGEESSWPSRSRPFSS